VPTADRERLGALAIDRLLDLPEVREARRVMVFWSFGSEIDTAGLIEALPARGAAVALPRIEGRDLVPIAYAPGDPTSPTTFGAREPSRGERLDPATLDVVVVPALAFDRGGRRVGYGGGYFDRFLADAAPAAFKVGLGFSVQLVDGPLPSGASDVRLDAVVTDREVVRCAPGRT
jgi:5-formyltetrahydrofolate cyclo-ligase